MLLILSELISRVFDFPTWGVVGLFLAVFHTGLVVSQILVLAPLLFIWDILLPIIWFFILIKKHEVSDIDITKREERSFVLGPAALIFLSSSIFVYFLGSYKFFVLAFCAFLIAFSLFLISLMWKISGHMLINSSFIIAINYLFDWKYLWLLAILPFVALARLYMKKHTPAQLIAGTFLGILEPLLVLKIFNLI